MELYHILEWVLPALTVAAFAFCIFWFRLFAGIGMYSNWHRRPRRRRWWNRR